MGIRFFCPNGHKLNVKEFQAGRRGICPFCGAKIRIPTESTREASHKGGRLASGGMADGGWSRYRHRRGRIDRSSGDRPASSNRPQSSGVPRSPWLLGFQCERYSHGSECGFCRPPGHYGAPCGTTTLMPRLPRRYRVRRRLPEVLRLLASPLRLPPRGSRPRSIRLPKCPTLSGTCALRPGANLGPPGAT